MPFRVFVELGVSCYYCPVTKRSHVTLFENNVLAGDRLPELRLPDGWHLVDGQPVCPQHLVRVSLTGSFMTRLHTAKEVAWNRSEPVDPAFVALMKRALASCATTHNGAGRSLKPYIHRTSVSRLAVKLYEPGPNRVFSRGDGWIRPLGVIAAAGVDSARVVCLHRNTLVGDYWVFWEEPL